MVQMNEEGPPGRCASSPAIAGSTGACSCAPSGAELAPPAPFVHPHDAAERSPAASSEAGADPQRMALSRIPGLAVEVGLRTVGGREASLVRLVRRYEELHAGDGPTLKSAVSGGQHGAALNLAHSVKGAAGFLGLVQIQAVAAELEAALREGSTGASLEALLDRFDQENLRTCGAIRAHLG